MSMTIGRAAIADDPDLGSLRVDGDRVSFESDIAASSVDECKARMQQLRGLLDNPDEDVFPFTWSEDPTFDGFYRVRRLEVSPNVATLASGSSCPFRIELERVAGGFAWPRFETVATRVLRTNAHGVTTPSAIVAARFTPAAYTWSDTDLTGLLVSPFTSWTAFSLTTEDGTVDGYYTTGAATYHWRHFVKAADFYKGGARLEVKYGSTWYPVHGQQIPAATAGDWRISNGYCRVYPSSSTTGRFTVETWRSPSWVGREFFASLYDSTGAGYESDKIATGDATGFVTPTVLVNSPELVVVRCTVGTYTHDFALRAGDTWVEVTQKHPAYGADFIHLAVGCGSTVASTAFTGGLRATANDANGLRFLLAGHRAVTTDLVNGRMYVTGDTSSSVTWQITADYQAGVVTTDTAVRDLFLMARSERRRVVAR